MIKSQNKEHLFSDVKKNVIFDLNQENFNFIKTNLLNFDYYFFKAYSMTPWSALPIDRRRSGVWGWPSTRDELYRSRMIIREESDEWFRQTQLIHLKKIILELQNANRLSNQQVLCDAVQVFIENF